MAAAIGKKHFFAHGEEPEGSTVASFVREGTLPKIVRYAKVVPMVDLVNPTWRRPVEKDDMAAAICQKHSGFHLGPLAHAVRGCVF